MARLLDDDGRRHDDGADMSGSCGLKDHSGGGCSDGDSSGSGSGKGKDRRRRHRKHHRRCNRLIPVNNIEIDCTPVTFSTPGQARNVVSCAVSQTLMVPVTRTVNVQTPGPFGCIMCTPMTDTIQVPVTATVNIPPTLVPVPRLVCPPGSQFPSVSAPIISGGCGCHG